MQKIERTLVILSFISLITIDTVTAQAVFWSDDFEGTNSTNGLRTPSNNGGVGGPPYTAYFCRTPAKSTVSQVIAFTGFQGANYWAGEAHNAAGTGFAGAGTLDARQQNITWTGINIAGRSSLSFTGSFAANSSNQPFDNRNPCNGGATTNTDYVIVQSSIDGGPWIDRVRFFSMGPLTQKYLFLETTGDSCGDGAQITNVFQDFSANIEGTGTTLSLRLLAFSDAGNEEWGVDNFRLLSAGTLPLTWASFITREQANGVMLNWSTASEQRTKDFIVQCSSDGNNWKNLRTVAARGNGNGMAQYSYMDENPVGQTSYYRILQSDMDGKTTISPINIVKLKNILPSFVVSPNPSTNGILQIQVRRSITLWLYNADGKLIWKKQVDQGSVSIPTTNYSKGLYSLKAENKSLKVLLK